MEQNGPEVPSLHGPKVPSHHGPNVPSLHLSKLSYVCFIDKVQCFKYLYLAGEIGKCTYFILTRKRKSIDIFLSFDIWGTQLALATSETHVLQFWEIVLIYFIHYFLIFLFHFVIPVT